VNVKRKLILFDIDGTLITTQSVAVSIMVESVARVLGHPINWNIRDFVGNTDRNILFTLFRRNGCNEAIIEDFVEEAIQFYLKELARELEKNSVVKVLPGAKELLKKLEKDNRFALGLVTGNLREGARIKLIAADLYCYFPVGAFGDDGLCRENLPPVAIQRAEQYYQCFFEKKDIWIVGDSINDIRCAHTNHLHCLAVASGHTKKNELLAYKPTLLVDDLLDTEKVIHCFITS